MVRKLESWVTEGRIEGHEVVIFTDNMLFKSYYYKGASTSEKLSDSIFRFHKAEKDGHFKLHIIHVAGIWTKGWGIDGLSQGDLMKGILVG